VGRVANKVALVTGVANPVAAASGRALLQEGARVVLADPDPAAAEAALRNIGASAADGLALGKAVADENAWEQAVARATEVFGRLDILVNGPPRVFVKTIDAMTLEDLRFLEEHNIVEPWLGMKHVIPAMRGQGGGAIINLSLALARTGAPGVAGNCATAAGVRVMSQAAAIECGQHSDGIRVNSVLMSHDKSAAPDEVAAAVVYLASDEARFMTAGEIVIDEGFLAS
jgi:NAD(P)-dependent dehydrogenase (short-subunit alcohol dehydrogenase family)